MSPSMRSVIPSHRHANKARGFYLALTILAMSLLGSICMGARPANANDRQRTICHIPRGNPSHCQNITVDISTVAQHVRDGDFDGRCEDDCNLNPNSCQTHDKCSVATCDQSTGHCSIQPKVCPNTDCTLGICNPRTGGCVGVPLTGKRCDDGNACTERDRCKNGRCEGRPVNCDDHNPCTTDSCDPTLGCQNVDSPDCSECPNGPSDCQDNNVCNGVEQCVNGHCVPGTPPTCVSTDPCLTAACDPTSGCTLTPNTNACSDGNPCTAPDICSNGSCQSGPMISCDDGDPCTVDSCDAALGGCQHQMIPGCRPCATPQDCGGDQCNPQTCKNNQCVSLPSPVCDDNNPCTADGCDPASGCFNTPLTGPQCASGDVCTGFSSCENGVCTPVAPTTCDDGNPCTIDTCTAAGCSSTPGNEGASCTTASGAAGSCMSGSCISLTCTDCESKSNGCTDLCPAVFTAWESYMQCVYQSGVSLGFGPDWCDPTVCGVGNCLDVAIGIFGAENPIGSNCPVPCTQLP